MNSTAAGSTATTSTASQARHRRLCGALAAGLVAAALTTLPAAPALAAECGPATVWTSSPSGGSSVVLEYSPTGEVLRTLTVAGLANLTDIAISADGSQLWGISSNTDLYEIDVTTGAVISSAAVTGPWTGFGNALSILPNGNLVTTGSDPTFSFQQLYEIDPTTLTSTAIVGAALPPGYMTAGDFLTIGPETLLITVTTPEAYDAFYVMDLSTTPATGAVHGHIPPGYGAAQAGGAIFIAGWDGILYRAAGVPAEPTEEDVEVTVVADVRESGTANLVTFYGAASPEDAGECAPSTGGDGAAPQLAATGGVLDFAAVGLALLTLVGGAVLVGSHRSSRTSAR